MNNIEIMKKAPKLENSILDGVIKVVFDGQGEITTYTRKSEDLWECEYCRKPGKCEEWESLDSQGVKRELEVFMVMYSRNLEINGKKGERVISIHE
ncbi:hypothetical protein [Lentiprolixibacter aurantiacus]|uniref:Uncharacterized protein n=1 Tax=Lentiprolixibacter aurantiacus TaxID=2993939 RepID=A0AAE3MJC2_9FLAO|nr:hypothetical protein [Lentiprolixibacter aurantiacus]MCX2718760.1 hypothetical protein [Lentiprolixibacter aurantiacus]